MQEGACFRCRQAVQLGRESQLFCELADAFGNKVESAAASGADLKARQSAVPLNFADPIDRLAAVSKPQAASHVSSCLKSQLAVSREKLSEN